MKRLLILMTTFTFGGADAQILYDPLAPIPLLAYYETLFSLPSGPPECGHLRIKAQLLATPLLAKGQASFEDLILATEAAKAFRTCAGTPLLTPAETTVDATAKTAVDTAIAVSSDFVHGAAEPVTPKP